MRTLLLLLISVAVVLPATETNPRVTRLMETFTASATAAEEAYQQAIQQAEAARAAALTTARDRTITGLKRLVNNRSGVAEQAEVYTQVLRLNREDADAVRFFTAIGTLDQVLAGLKPAVETDLVGNVVAAGSPGSQVATVVRGPVQGTGYVEQVPDEALTASSIWRDSPSHGAHQARLSNVNNNSNWKAGVMDTRQWIQVDLGRVMPLGGIATMGRARQEPSRLTSYRILISDDGSDWNELSNINGGTVHMGNNDQSTQITHVFAPGTRGRYVRIAPVTWNHGIDTRFEVYAPDLRALPDAELIAP